MRNLLILFAILITTVSCYGRFGGKMKNLIDDGHDYQWVTCLGHSYIIHSPECELCKEIRKEETINIVDSIVNQHLKRD